MATCPKHGTYWGRCESCAEEHRRDDEERWAKREADRIAQLEADNAKLREEIGLLQSEAKLDGLNVKRLRAQLALAEAVCEALDGSCASDIVGNDGVKALAAWRAGKQKSEKHERDAE